MKVSSTVPFTFRRTQLSKGESEFDLSKLNASEKKYFDELVKTEIVFVLEEKLGPAPVPTPPEPSSAAPAADATKPTKKA